MLARSLLANYSVAASAVCLAALASGCDPLGLEEPEPNCHERHAYYPDSDGDGLGEPTSVYVGCTPPAGYVSDLEPDTDDTDPVDTDG